jgi:hypothetical protein
MDTNEMSMIATIESIKEFEYFNDNIKVGKSATGVVVTNSNFIDQTIPFKQVIGFYTNKGQYIKLDLRGKIEDTLSKALYWGNFSDHLLKSLSKELNFKLKSATHKNEVNSLIGYVENLDSDFNAHLAIKKTKDSFYIVVFFMDLPDLERGAGRFEGKLYLHGIWEAQLSDDFKKQIYWQDYK